MLKSYKFKSTSSHSFFFQASLSSHPRPPLPSLLSFKPLKVQLRKNMWQGRICCVSEEMQPSMAKNEVDVDLIKAVVTINKKVEGILSNLRLEQGIDMVTDLFGRSMLLELVSNELDPRTGLEKETLPGYAHKVSQEGEEVRYESSFKVPKDFGEIGGVFVTNEHHKEMFLKDITLQSNGGTTLSTLTCNSWVHAKSDSPDKRIFFTNKSYLPDQTPRGLTRLRKTELEKKRGNGQGERKAFERIYDYDTYNDLGDPDHDEDKARPVLGGSKKYPYPRRCRTGRPRSEKDPETETRSSSIYVPRDEAFSEVKSSQFYVKTIRSLLPAVVSSVKTAIVDINLGFPSFTAIDTLFDDGFKIPTTSGGRSGLLRRALPRLLKAVSDGRDELFRFDKPTVMDKDLFRWLRDEEFARETLAGVNPYAIQLVTEFPLASKLDPDVYGPPESAITVEMIEEQIKGVMTVKEVVEGKKLFMLDYHDLLLPYVQKVRALHGTTTLYGSRTIFFLTGDGTLRPLAIELTRPPSPENPQWKHVYTPCWKATGTWLWTLAKAHVRAHDSCYHELISHWLRTHCCMEPVVIAANRQLSEMHPIYRLLHPHFRYTMEINSIARQNLISAGGVIESSFSLLKYSIELSSVAYGQLWRFDMEALPADLIRRGMAEEDSMAEHGLRLTVEDYPFANDGLLIWSAIKDWVHDYVSYYYPDSTHLVKDHELQSWWTEVRTQAHADKKNEPWWPKLDTLDTTIQALTTIIWVASGHHAAVNFGQYQFGGYFPNRPAIARINMPNEDVNSDGYAKFLDRPMDTLLQCFPSQIQATVVMAVLDVLSTHSPDEEYLGGPPEFPWRGDTVIEAAYQKFSKKLKDIEGVIDARNSDHKLNNRFGAGIQAYELMKPYSSPGVTGKGIPNSISI